MKPFCARYLRRLSKQPLISLFLGVGALLAPLPVWGGVVIDRVVTVVNREVITQSEIDLAEQALRNEKKGEALTVESPGRGADAERDLLSRIIEKKLILQEAHKKGIRLTDAELELALKDIEERNHFQSRVLFQAAVAKEGLSWEKYTDDLKDQLTLLKLMNREVEVNLLVREEEVRSYYDGHPEQFKLPDQIRLKQILFRLPAAPTEEQAARVREKAERALAAAKGGEAFGRLAEEFGEGAERRKEGDLGYFKKGDLSPEIDRIVFGLDAGAISPLVRTGLGFHIFKVEERQTGRRQPFEKVQKETEERLLSDKREEARRKWLDEVWARSFVDVK